MTGRTRGRTLLLLGLLAGTLLGGAACAGMPGATPAAPDAAGAAAPAAPPDGQVLRVGAPRPSLPQYEPGLVNSAATLQYFTPAFDGLTWVDDSGLPRPGLASQWSTADGITWTFTVRPGMVFHDGQPVTAAAVQASFDRYLDPDARFTLATALARVDRVEAPDPATVVIRLRRMEPTLPRLVSLAMILPPGTGRDQDALDAFLAAPVGTGPFQVDGPVDLQQGLAFRRTPAGFVAPRGAPDLAAIQLFWIPETAAREAALESGELDVATTLLPDSALRLQEAGYATASRLSQTTVHFLLRQDSGPLADVRVRQAVNHAVDRQDALDRLLQGFGRLDQAQLLGPGVLGYDPALPAYPYDPAQARRLLAAAGFPNGFSGRMTVVQNPLGGREIGEVVAAGLTAAGIGVEIEVQEPAVWLRHFYGTPEQRGEFFVSFLNWEQTFEAGSVYRFFSADQPATSRRWNNPAFDRLYQQAKGVRDDARRGELYRQAARIMREEAGALFLWQPGLLAAMRPGVRWDPGLFADRWITAGFEPGP